MGSFTNKEGSLKHAAGSMVVVLSSTGCPVPVTSSFGFGKYTTWYWYL